MMLSSTRFHCTLDGAWRFCCDPDGVLTPDALVFERSLDVPAPWQAQADDLRTYQGVAWYGRSFEVPPEWDGLRVFLHFGAVDYEAQVWVNGILVGNHIGGYLPFECDMTAAAWIGGANEVIVRVCDPSDDSRYTPPFSEIPHGKQSWYGALSGIWQSVTLEARAALHIAALRVTPEARTGVVTTLVELNTAPPPDAQLVLTLYAPGGGLVAETQVTAAMHMTVDLTAPTVDRWDLDHPALYTLSAVVQTADTCDRARTRFGFRTLEARDGVLWLNDRPLMLRGALDQDYYPETIYTPPSYEFLLRQAQLARRMGLNCLRCHIKIADPRYLQAADETGLLVWAELPNWQHWTPEGGERGVATLSEAILRDWNHPSVVIWSVINESWGVDLSNPEHRAWLRSAFDRIKAIAGDRLVVDNSACFNNFHLKSDLDDYHFYAAMPDERDRWREWVGQFAARARWSYGAELPPVPAGQERWTLGDAGYGEALPEVERSKQEPLIVSEFGNWGLPSLADLRGPSGRDPWWFETGDDWGDSVVYPHGVEKRFERLGLARIFGDYERFSVATRRAELDALRFEIEEMRRHPAISGYVITEFTDVHWECNGLLDMRRNPKMPLDALAALNADTVLIPDREGGALWAGEQRRIPLLISHWGAAPLAAPEVRLSTAVEQAGQRRSIEDHGVFVPVGVQSIAVRETAALGEVVFSAPRVAAPTLVTLRIEVWSQGRRTAATELRLPVYPRPAGVRPHIYVEGDAPLRAALAAQGYVVHDTPGSAPTVSVRFDEALRVRVQAGERVILLADEQSITAPLGIQARARAGTAWQGSWASSFGWMAGAWAGDGILDESFMRVMPTHVLTGFAQQGFPSNVEAGLCVGWIQQPAALIGSRRLGRGSVNATTFRLAGAIGADPVATWIFDRIVGAYAGA